MVKDGHFSFQTQLPKLKSNSLQEKNDLYLCSFSIIFFNISFSASWSLFRINRIFQVHDMTINFSFVFFSFTFLSFFWMVYSRQCHMLWMAFQVEVSLLVWGLFCFWLFGPKLFIPLLSTKRVMAQKYFREMGNFRLICPKTLIKVISGYHDLGILFCSLKRFGRIETVASFDVYQIIKYQFFQKLVIFCCLISEEFEKEFLNQEF